MFLMKPKCTILWETPDLLQTIESIARVCYKSEEKITPFSYQKFLTNLLEKGHEAMFEHAVISAQFICDRGVSHELVRHRIASFAQESTRYCNYKGGVTFIIPPWLDTLPEGKYNNMDYKGDCRETRNWLGAMNFCEVTYLVLLGSGWTPQQARSVLPNSLKTEIVITANVREWRHIIKLRTAPTAHPQMVELIDKFKTWFKLKYPTLSSDL